MGIRDANPNPNPNPYPNRYGLTPRPDPAQVLHASSEVFASALRDPSGRADEAVAARRRGGGLWFYVPDEAVARRERTSAYLEQCEGTLRTVAAREPKPSTPGLADPGAWARRTTIFREVLDLAS